MQPDPARSADTQEWLRRAALDLRAAEYGFRARPPLTADIVFQLTEYAWKFRYPGEPDEPPLSEAQEALDLAREVYQAVLGRLPEDARPRP